MATSDLQLHVDAPDAVRVELNGKPASLAPGTTVAALLAGKGLQDKLVVVELNGTILERSAFVDTALAPGDRIEVVHFVGGG